jgi:hypothetical protein
MRVTAKSLASLIAVMVLAAACGGDSPTSPTTGSGSTTASTSHNAGRDCLGCHSFTVAGTVYRAGGVAISPGAVLRLTTASAGGGTVVATLTADGSGNFYTGLPVSFGTGLFVTAASTAGAVRSKAAPITSGACNRCHTSGTRIIVD